MIEEAGNLKPATKGFATQMSRIKRRYEEIVAMDFFESSMRFKAEEAVTHAEQPQAPARKTSKQTFAKDEYQSRTWLTRPRPGIDRVSSAWLISRFIDATPQFAFGSDPSVHPDAIPFHMFQGGFSHEDDRCTFETLCLAFGLTDRKALRIAEAIHDADLEDGKYGRSEGHTMNQILKGWAAQGIPDDELLRRGMDLTEGPYNSIPINARTP